jgi:hypothetical protein
MRCDRAAFGIRSRPEADTFGEFYNDTACATLVFVDGLLYAPISFRPTDGQQG